MLDSEIEQHAKAMAVYHASPAAWVIDHIDIDLAHYRSEESLRAWLATVPPDSHEWCRKQLAAGKLCLDDGVSYQAEMLDKLAKPGWYAFKWANGTSKTTIAALFILYMMDVYTDLRILTTAGTWSQLQEQLWREVPLWLSRTKFDITAQGHIGRDSIHIPPPYDAHTISRAAYKAANFEGIHAKHVVVLVDEAKAIAPDIYDAIRRILRGGEDAKLWLILLSSPGSPSGPFYDLCTGSEGSRVQVLSLSAYESERVSLDQIHQDALELGEDSPLFIAMDCGEFPDEGEDSVIPLSWVQANVDRKVEGFTFKSLGVDMSYSLRGDRTCLIGIFGREVRILDSYRGREPSYTAGRIQDLNKIHQFHAIGIDDPGKGVVDMCRQNGLKIQDVVFGSKAYTESRYVNLKAEMYFKLRAELEAGYKDPGNEECGLSLPDDKTLHHQLTVQGYRYDLKNRILIESKDELRKRGESSPDYADALAIANLMRASRTNRILTETNRTTARHTGAGASVRKAEF